MFKQPDFKEVIEFDKDDYIKMLDSINRLKKKIKLLIFLFKMKYIFNHKGNINLKN